MARVKRAVHAKKSHKKVLDRAKGYKGARSRRYRTANEQVMHAMQDAYRDRRARKGEFRRLWIARINAAARQNGITYNQLIAGFKANEIEVDRKMLAEMAVNDPGAFAQLVEASKQAEHAREADGMMPVRSHKNRQVVEAARLHRARERTGAGSDSDRGPAPSRGGARRRCHPVDPVRAGGRSGNARNAGGVRESIWCWSTNRGLSRVAGTKSPRGPVAVIEIPEPSMTSVPRSCGGLGVSRSRQCGHHDPNRSRLRLVVRPHRGDGRSVGTEGAPGRGRGTLPNGSGNCGVAGPAREPGIRHARHGGQWRASHHRP